jgi:hypothetical protein
MNLMNGQELNRFRKNSVGDECKYNLSHDVDSERHPHFRAYYCNHPKGILIGQSECDEAEFVCRSIDDPEGSEKRMMEG